MRANVKMPLDALTQAQALRKCELAIQYPNPQVVTDRPPVGWIMAGILWTFVAVLWVMAKPQ